MTLNPPANPNYAAVVVRLAAVNALDGCDNIAGAPVLGYQAIVGKDRAPGDLGVVFTAETALSEEFARVNNLHREAELNQDPAEKGYLEKTRRVRAIKLRGHRSDALFLPLEALAYTGFDVTKLAPGDTFDELNGHEICRKFEVARKVGATVVTKNKTKVFTRVDQRMFPLHFSTDNYFRVRDSIDPETEIIVSAKYHGSSWRGANTVVARKLSWRERVAKRLGVRVQETEHDHVFGSRRVLKDINSDQGHFYLSDIWSEAGARLGNILPANFMVFGELVGWTGDGAAIQKDYEYSLPKGTSELFIYRVAQLNPQGRITDLAWDQVVELCGDLGLKTVPVLWRGKHSDFDVDQFLDVRFHDLGYDTLPLGPNKKLVDEGVCIRVDGLSSYIAKAKSARFFAHETGLNDKGIVDLETLESAA